MAHHLIGVSASMSGLDLGSFGEHIFAPDLAFLVYRRGMTMDLGNLSSIWRDRGDPAFGNEVLDQMVNPVSLRCGSESICNHRGGACPDCILIPENACRLYGPGWLTTRCEAHAEGRQPEAIRSGLENIHIVERIVGDRREVTCRRYDRDADAFVDVDPRSLGIEGE
jgi:hypothetical protein